MDIHINKDGIFKCSDAIQIRGLNLRSERISGIYANFILDRFLKEMTKHIWET